MGGIIGVLFLMAVVITPLFLTVRNILNMRREEPWHRNAVEGATLILGAALTVGLYGGLGLKEWEEPIVLGGELVDVHAALAGAHMPTIMVLAGLAMFGFFLLRFFEEEPRPPLMVALCLAADYIGCILAVVWIVQLTPFWAEQPFLAFFLCLFPANFLLLSADLTRGRMKNPGIAPGEGRLHQWLEKGARLPFLAFLLIWPLLGILILALTLFGQQPDAAIKAFTETSDWLLSAKVSPPPVEYEGHYLCTAAIVGHPKVVKPARLGLRRGEKIVVNRQLCVANAFEDLIAEKAPRFHNWIRGVYDRYGYPLSRHITTPLRGDVTYLLMKPLEWCFLAALYLVDTKPENRIARQYLPIK